jgi:hypothetical protein
LRARTRYGRHFGEQRVDALHGACGIAASALDQPRGHALLVLKQRFRNMLRTDPLVVHADRDGLRRLQKALGAIGEFFEVHLD